MQCQSRTGRPKKAFYPEAARRLFFAVINQAVQDVLENGREAEDAETWLLSQDFDLFCAPFGCNPEVVRQELAHKLAAMPVKASGTAPVPHHLADFLAVAA